MRCGAAGSAECMKTHSQTHWRNEGHQRNNKALTVYCVYVCACARRVRVGVCVCTCVLRGHPHSIRIMNSWLWIVSHSRLLENPWSSHIHWRQTAHIKVVLQWPFFSSFHFKFSVWNGSLCVSLQAMGRISSLQLCPAGLVFVYKGKREMDS